MKSVLSVLAMVLSFSAFTTAQAADKKIGNLIAVERTIDNVYQTCAAQIKNETSPKQTANGEALPSFFACKLDAGSKDFDFMPKYQRLLTHSDSVCDIEGFAQNSSALITVQMKGKSLGAENAKNCLQRALDASENKDSFKFTIFTIE